MFFGQNCVTKVHDLFVEQDLLSSGQRLAAHSVTTYRQLIGYYLDDNHWMHLGINLLLGRYADQKPVGRSYSFLPYRFQHLLQAASLNSGKQLVQSTRIISSGEKDKAAGVLTPQNVLWLLFLFVVGLSLAALWYDFRASWLDRLLFGLIGLLGAVILVLSVASPRAPLQHNWNLLWALPTHLWIVFFKRSKQMRYYFWFTIILYGGVLVGWSFIPQELPLAILPIIGSLIVRSAFRLYMNSQCSTLNRDTKISNHESSQKMNLQPVKKQ